MAPTAVAIATEEQQNLGASLKADDLVPPRQVTALILRIHALVKRLIPVQVSKDAIDDPDGLINASVAVSFARAGGDLKDVVPFALLEAKKIFGDSNNDEELNTLRSSACEVLARRVIYQLFKSGPAATDGTFICLSKRFSYIDASGDRTLPTSALESAVDQSSIVVLSSPEAQACVDAIWKGRLVQSYVHGNDRVDFVPWKAEHNGSFWDHFDPNRLAVPRFLYSVSLVAWIALLVVYSLTTRTYTGLDGWEIALWVMLLGFSLEDLSRWWKLRGLEALSIWLIIDVVQDILAMAALAVRIVSFVYEDPDHTARYQRVAFQLLACLAPLLWIQLLKVVDINKFFGLVLQSLVRMLQETSIFLVLLFFVGAGFAQALFSLDAADGGRTPDATRAIVQTLLSGLLGGGQSLDIVEEFGRPYSEILLYSYSLVQVLFLTNILVALLNNAYSDIVADADDVFAAYFATKCVGLIRAPDQFVYPAPLNLLEIFLIAPLEYVLSRNSYTKLNRIVQIVLFAPQLAVIALYESRQGDRTMTLDMLHEVADDDAQDSPERALAAAIGLQNVQDPGSVGDQDDSGRGVGTGRRDEPTGLDSDAEAPSKISQVSFARLASTFPTIQGGTEDDEDRDPTTGVVSGANIKKEEAEEDGKSGQSASAVANAGQEALLKQLLEEMKALRDEVAAVKAGRS